MYIKLSANQFFDDQGFPLVAGRVSVFYYNSDTLANIYSLENDEYVAMVNPVTLTDEGRTPSIWFEATRVTVRVEKYNNLEDSYELVCTYTDGFEIPDAKNDTIVTGMSGLATANPELGTVSVVGYNNSADCGQRVFVWDPSCTVEEDGGAIVASSVEDTGRWILCSDLREMPSSFYGIKPGDEANISAFISYPESVGQWGIKLPPVPRFQAGTYTTPGTLSTPKTLSFDPGAKFTNAKIVCRNAEVSNVNDYIADFQFTGNGVEAHSGWFRTVEGFWHCNAGTYFIDSTNYFASFALTSSASISNATIIGDSQIATTYSNQSYITLTNVNVIGRVFRMGSDFVLLQGSGWGDRIFTGAASAWDPGRIQDGHHVQFANVPLLADFESADKWYAVMHERKERVGITMSDEVDFENRSVSSQISLGSFTTLKNVGVGSVFVTGSSCVLYNVKTTLNVDSDGCAIQANDSDIVISQASDGITFLGGNESNIQIAGAVGLDPTDCAITMNGGHFKGIIHISDANADTYAAANLVSFNNVTIDQMFVWRVNKLSMRGCFGPVKVDLLPHKSGNDYVYSLDLMDNIFAGDTRFWFTMYGTNASPHTEIAGHVKFANVRISGNQFRGSGFPVKMLRKHPFSFTQFVADDVGDWEYTDNVGNCPKVRPDMVVNGSGVWGSSQTGPDSYPFYMRTTADYIWCPYFHYVDGAIDYMRDGNKEVTMGEWIGGFPAMNSSYNFFVLGGLKKGQNDPADYWDEDGNNMFIVYTGFSAGAPMSDLATGRLMWPVY